MTLAHHADRGHVIRTEDRGRTHGSSDQASEGRHASLHGVVAFNHQLRVSFEADFLHGTQKCLFSGHRGFQTQRPGDEGNFFVAQSSQMLHRLADSVEIVNPDIAHPGSRRPDIDEDQRHLPELQVFEQHFFHAERHDRDALHPALNHAADSAFHALRVVSR